jgi:hypothetical protein
MLDGYDGDDDHDFEPRRVRNRIYPEGARSTEITFIGGSVAYPNCLRALASEPYRR